MKLMQEDINRQQCLENANDQFYIYDENLVKIGVKARKLVHADGDWHRGIQLNIICGDEILLQIRAGSVDIAKNLIDQSLATQLLVQDDEDEYKALARGLKDELGITPSLDEIIKVASDQKIIKTYEYDSSLYNREFVTLFEWRLKEKRIFKPNSTKVELLLWMHIDEVKRVALDNPNLFTKTFYMWLTTHMDR